MAGETQSSVKRNEDVPIDAALGEYRIKGTLGRGRYALTCRVESQQGDFYAAKWLQPDSPPDGRDRLANEQWALAELAKLNHPSIPSLIASGTQENRPYIVMSLAEGENLAKSYERQCNDGTTISQRKTLQIAQVLLDILARMHSLGMSHRDIQLGNIVTNEMTDRERNVSTSEITLVDYGTIYSLARPRDVHAFYNEGTSRFNPPEKLKHPDSTVLTQDVFAVGVIGYMLLTNVYPWSVETAKHKDRGHLEDLMRTTTPRPIHHMNNMVDSRLSKFFMSLLQVDDAKRPSATDALKELEKMKDALGKTKSFPVPGRQRLTYPRVMRDPIHSDIVMTEFEWSVIKTPEFQRLRWMRQLGTSHLVYPGAEHTRFSHAIGSMQVASHIMQRIEQRTGDPFDAVERLTARLYALVHDVTHVPYGHSLEDEMQIFARHDENPDRVERLLTAKSSELGKLLRSEQIGQAVLEHLGSNVRIAKKSWIVDLLEQPCGADVLDYIERDAYHCGLDQRIDSAIYRRLSVHQTLVTELYGKHGPRSDADFALETILRERFAMFLKVYTHPAKVAAGAMLGKAVWRALKAPGKPLTEKTIERMGDDELMYYLKNQGPALAKRLAQDVRHRNLWKRAFRARALPERDCQVENYDAQIVAFKEKGLLNPTTREKLEAKLAREVKLSPGEVILYCPAKAPGFQKLQQYVAPDPRTQQVRGDSYAPHLRVRQAHLSLWTVYAFIPPEHAANPNNRECRHEEMRRTVRVDA